MRTAMAQPAGYFMLQAPFVNIIGLYSNMLEDPGAIPAQAAPIQTVHDDQLAFLENALKQADKRGGAILITSHHPPFSGGGSHSGSLKMLAEIDAICRQSCMCLAQARTLLTGLGCDHSQKV